MTFYILTITIAYLLGSIPSAVLISRLMQLPDPRTVGSGNPGATNVLRSGSKIAAALVLIADSLKGIPAIVLAYLLSFPPVWLYATAFAALLGHMYSIFLGFKGGKGVATTLGILAVLYWPLAVCWAGVWLIVAKLLGYSSLAALAATGLLPPIAFLLHGSAEFLVFLIALTIMVFWRHRQNIKNLLHKQETRI